MNAVTVAIEKAGGVGKLARQFKGRNGKLLSYQAVLKWERLGVPEQRIQEFSSVTGIPPSKIRPDLAALFNKEAA